jgi:CheY-like chemotaxis protein
VGVEVTTAQDGTEAIALYTAAREKGSPFDLLILDMTVPGGLGGIQVMEELRKTYPNVRAIVSSGYSSELSVANYEECGFLDVVPKPYEMNDLTCILAKHLRHD